MPHSKSLVSGTMNSSGAVEIKKVDSDMNNSHSKDKMEEDYQKNNGSEAKTAVSEDIDDGIYSVSSNDWNRRQKKTSLCSCFQLVCYNRRFL